MPKVDLVEGVGGCRRFGQRIVDRERVVLGYHLGGGGFLGVGKQIAVNRAAVQPVHRVGIAQDGGFEELLVGRVMVMLGLQQRQQFFGCNLFPRLVREILPAPGS